MTIAEMLPAWIKLLYLTTNCFLISILFRRVKSERGVIKDDE